MRTITELQENIGLTAVALGYFDGMHPGHVAVIDAAVKTAQWTKASPALLTFDMSAFRPRGKGTQDIDTPQQKEARAAALGIELYVSLDFAAIAPLSGNQFVDEVLARDLGAVYVCCGQDFRFGKERACGIDDLRALCALQGIEVVTVPDVLEDGQPISTTRIKAALKEGNIPLAGRLLGRPYSFTLRVYEEKHLARRLGFPTINQRFPEGLVEPRHGVYYTKVYVDGACYGGVSNLGSRPTVESDGATVLETHLLDFSGDLYGRDIEVAFVQFLRPEEKFASVEEMRARVQQDIREVRRLFAGC